MKESRLTESIRDGSYFEEGRRFYSEVYLSIISERVLYLVLTSIAMTTSLIAIIALIRLLPITPTEPFMLRTQDAVHSLPLIKGLAIERSELPDEALKRFFVHQYVTYRESYAKDKIAPRARAIFHWSTRETYDIFRRLIDTSNPRSPVVQYESSAEREIVVENSLITPDPSAGPEAYIAKVDFVAYVIRMGKVESSNWTADLSFIYKNAVVEQDKVNPKTGKMIVEPMKFTVNSYAVRERKAEELQ